MSKLKERTPEQAWQACFPVPMETAVILQQNTEQLGTYLVQMAQMLTTIQRRLDEMEKDQRMVTLSHDEVLQLRVQIQLRANEYCEKYGLTDAKDTAAIRAAIKKSILQRYRIRDLHDCPKIALEAIVKQVDRWADIRMVMKIREKHREDGA